MLPEMPGLVPVNHTLYLNNLPPLVDAQLYQNLDNQILLVKEIQGILDMEQIKLESLMKELERRKLTKERPGGLEVRKSFEKSKEIICVRSPFAINNNLSMEFKANKVEKERDEQKHVEILGSKTISVDKPSKESIYREERFRNFWSGFNNIEEDDIKEEPENINIEQLLVEEMKMRRLCV